MMAQGVLFSLLKVISSTLGNNVLLMRLSLVRSLHNDDETRLNSLLSLCFTDENFSNKNNDSGNFMTSTLKWIQFVVIV
jgi:hypothetical protein